MVTTLPLPVYLPVNGSPNVLGVTNQPCRLPPNCSTSCHLLTQPSVSLCILPGKVNLSPLKVGQGHVRRRQEPSVLVCSGIKQSRTLAANRTRLVRLFKYLHSFGGVFESENTACAQLVPKHFSHTGTSVIIAHGLGKVP